MDEPIESGDLEFPVLAFSQGLLYHLRDREELERCSYAGWRNQWFAKMEIIDSVGGLYRVISAEPRKRLGFFDRLLNRRLRVNLVVARKSKQPTLDDARERVRKRLNTFSSGGEVPALRREVEAARTFAELVAVVPTALSPGS